MSSAFKRFLDFVLRRQIRVVLNYRRDDTAGHAGRLYESLAKRFGAKRVFMDIDKIEPGTPFPQVIERAVGSCDAFIALIGRRWLTITDEEGRRRLDDPEDFVRQEIQTAIWREVRLIPVLVQDAEMPSADRLPAALEPFAHRHALEIRDSSWRYDVERLIETLEKVGREKRPVKERPRRARPALVLMVVALLAAATVAGVVLAGGDGGEPAGGFRTDPDGGTTGGAAEGDQLVYASDGRIYVVGIDGQGEVDLTDARGQRDESPDWSPDGDRLVFVRKGDIWTSDAEGEDDRQLTEASEYDGSPDWSPDGGRIAFDRQVVRGSSRYDLWVMNADGSKQRNLTPGDETGGAPDWSRDGRHFVYQRRSAVATRRVDGSEPPVELFRRRGSAALRPTWSPDGDEIAFGLFEDKDNSDIYLMDADGRNVRNLTKGRVDVPSAPAWAANGDFIVFAAADGIWLMQTDGGGLNQIVEGEDLESPSFRPTG
jgi:dipeptidyl aminopeptidase/acylaminoacyl peptidase